MTYSSLVDDGYRCLVSLSHGQLTYVIALCVDVCSKARSTWSSSVGSTKKCCMMLNDAWENMKIVG